MYDVLRAILLRNLQSLLTFDIFCYCEDYTCEKSFHRFCK